MSDPKRSHTVLTRIVCLSTAALLLFVEVLIALFVHDNFIRPYIGDVLVVILIWCLVRGIFPGRPDFLSPWIFMFAVLVECSQAIPLVELLGLDSIRFFVIIMGNSFAWADLLCYLCGCLPTAVIEWVCRRKRQKTNG
ncbi:MAG: DUF2809 domain-containing protein [Eubacteriales bacterium]